MKIKTQPRDDHQVTITAEVDAEKMVAAKHRAARRISERKKIPGFRPGKAPYDVVVRYIGEENIKDQAIDLLLDETYPEAINEAKIDPYGPGSLEKVDDQSNNPIFTFIVPLKPIIDLGNYCSVRLEYNWKEPGDDKVDEAIEELRRMHSKTENVQRPIEKGDFVMIDLKGAKEQSPEGEDVLIDQPGYPLFIQTKENKNEWPFSGFSNLIIGMSASENKSFIHKFEKDHNDESLQGESIRFDVMIKTIRAAILPELNDEFVKKVGAFENLQALRDVVRANLTTQSKIEYENDYFNRLVDKICEGATIKYPPQMIAREVDNVINNLQKNLAEQNMDLDTYLKLRKIDREKFIAEEAKPVAKRRIERSLITEEVARTEKIEVSDETLNATFQATWSELRASNQFSKIMRGKTKPPKRLIDAVAMESANRAYADQTLARLKQIATGQVKKSTSTKKKPVKSYAKE